jgi:hypothetical protein
MAKAAKEARGTETLEAVADRGYFSGEEIRTCVDAGVTVTLPKPMTSSAKADGRFGKEDFVYLAEENVYRCPAGEKLSNFADPVHATSCSSSALASLRTGVSKPSVNQS